MPFDPRTGLPSERPAVLRHCDVCGAVEVYTGKPHSHAALTPRQQRRLAAQARLNGIHAARARRPVECPDCHAETMAGVVHRCPGPVLDKASKLAMDFQTAGIVAQLQQAGYLVTRKD